MARLVDPARLSAPNGIEDEALLARLTADMKAHGWQGAALLVDGDRALQGSHRLAAAEAAGVLVPVVDFRDVAGVDWSDYRGGHEDGPWDFSALQDFTVVE